MKRKLINSQLSNFKTYQMYLRQLLTLTENVFEFKNLPKYIDTSFLNKCIVKNGSIAFFYDEYLGLIALPYTVLGSLDIYNRPQKILVSAPNGSYRRKLDQNEFIIMYDNNGRYPLYLDILQYSERLALLTRTVDINIAQQKTNRVWKTSTENELSVRNLLNNVDGFENQILTYKNLDLDDTQAILQPAPFVADKIEIEKEKIWNEFLRLIGIANMNFQKKERNIKDEVIASQGGTIASRFSRFEPRKKAVEMINEKFGKYLEEDIEVSYYDGLPSTVKDLEEDLFDENEESEVDENDV